MGFEPTPPFVSVAARFVSNQKPTFQPCSPQSPSSAVVRTFLLDHGSTWVQIPITLIIIFPALHIFLQTFAQMLQLLQNTTRMLVGFE